jgi:predicted alpha/beta hydrolase
MPDFPAHPFQVIATDGTVVQGSFWLGEGEGVKPVVTIHCATAVHSRYYARFAAWLAAAGFDVLSYDYRGIGASHPGQLRGFIADWVDWARLDADAVMRFAETRFPGRAYYAVGHSIGGVCATLAPASHRLTRIVTVGAQFAYWRDYDAAQRWKMLVRWHLLMPLLTELLGYFPGKRLGWLEDVPKGVVRNWSRMGPRFESVLRRGRQGITSLHAEEITAQFAGITAPILAVSATDDPFATVAATARLMGYWQRAPRHHLRLDPTLVGVPEIGHFGFFHARFAETLWPVVRAFLREGTVSGPQRGVLSSPL